MSIKEDVKAYMKEKKDIIKQIEQLDKEIAELEASIVKKYDEVEVIKQRIKRI